VCAQSTGKMEIEPSFAHIHQITNNGQRRNANKRTRHREPVWLDRFGQPSHAAGWSQSGIQGGCQGGRTGFLYVASRHQVLLSCNRHGTPHAPWRCLVIAGAVRLAAPDLDPKRKCR